MKIIPILLLLLSVTALTGCEKNPLLGTWKAKSGQSFLAQMCSEVVFTKGRSRCGSIIEEVSYEVEGNLVIVSSELGDKLGAKMAYEIVDKNTMTIDILGEKVTYSRYSY